MTGDWDLMYIYYIHICLSIAMLHLKRLLLVFSVWISCLIKYLGAYNKAHFVLILDPEKYTGNLFSIASSATSRHHKLVTLPSKIMSLGGRKKSSNGRKKHREKHHSIRKSLFQTLPCNCEILI